MPQEPSPDPAISLVKISKHAAKAISKTEFMTRIFVGPPAPFPHSPYLLMQNIPQMGTILTACDRASHRQKQIKRIPDSQHEKRSRLRSEIVKLLRRLGAQPHAQPAYDQVAADEIRDWLGDLQAHVDHDFATDFEALLATVERGAAACKARADEERERREARMAEAKAEKDAWDVVEENEASDEWEMI